MHKSENRKGTQLRRFTADGILFAVLLTAAVVIGVVSPAIIAAAKSTNPVASQFKAHHVALRVPNLEDAVAWYEDVLGAHVIRRSRVPHIDPAIEIAMMELNGFHIELVGNGNPERAIPEPPGIAVDYCIQGYKHVAFFDKLSI